MKLRTLLCTFTAAGACLAGASLALRQDAAPALLAREHALLKQMAGEWDASIAMMGETYSGRYTCRLAMNGLWLIEDFEGEMMGQKFVGHGFTGYDPAKGKYVAAWVDNMTASFEPAEGSWDESKRELVMHQAGVNPMTGERVKTKQVVRLPEGGKSMSFHMFMPGPDGSDMETMSIQYTRRK